MDNIRLLRGTIKTSPLIVEQATTTLYRADEAINKVDNFTSDAQSRLDGVVDKSEGVLHDVSRLTRGTQDRVEKVRDQATDFIAFIKTQLESILKSSSVVIQDGQAMMTIIKDPKVDLPVVAVIRS